MKRCAALLIALAAVTTMTCGPPQVSPPQGSGTAPAAQPAAQPPAPEPKPDTRPEPAPEPVEARVVEVSLADVGLEAAAMDRAADPCQDFYRFACGGWLDSNEIPADRVRYSRFDEVRDRTEVALKRILEVASLSKTGDPETLALGRFYGGCMDRAAIDKAGLSGIAPLMKAARGVTTRAKILAAITELHKHGIWAVFRIEREADLEDAAGWILFVESAGMGLPDRDYYLEDDASFKKARVFYRSHVERMFRLAGKPKKAAQRAAGDVMRIETELARASKSAVQRRNVHGMYNKIDRPGLARLAPRFDWDEYLAGLGQPDLKSIIVTTPRYLKHLSLMLKTVKPRAWSHYLQWQVLASMAGALPEKFGQESFALRSLLTGQPAQKPRWQRCVAATNEALGELVGKRYVAEAFSGESKEAAERMAREVIRVFAGEIAGLSWMGDKTREQALRKLDQMTHSIGYPESWRSQDFAVSRQDFAKSVLAARAHRVKRQLAGLDQPRDRQEWHTTPQTTTAYYNPLANQMVVPAAILQAPFFGQDRGMAANLGGMGMVMGHELTHGFDDMGARFDGLGTLRGWWQPDDEAAFLDKSRCLVEQYSGFEPLPGVELDGKLTLGESVADLGGVKLAFRAYRSLRKEAKTRYLAEGLSEDQQFFVAVGQAWCAETRETEIRRRVAVDSHAPPRFRVLGSLRNTPEMAQAFGCKEGTPMRPAQVCEVW